MAKKKQPDKDKKKEATKPLSEETKKEDTVDFGGLPERDLKKNLGCG